MNEFNQIKKNYEAKEKEIKQLEGKVQLSDKMLKIFKRELSKYIEFSKVNKKKWDLVTKNISEFTTFTRKSLDMHTEMGKISEENISLESSKRMMTFELTQSNMLSKSLIFE